MERGGRRRTFGLRTRGRDAGLFALLPPELQEQVDRYAWYGAMAGVHADLIRHTERALPHRFADPPPRANPTVPIPRRPEHAGWLFRSPMRGGYWTRQEAVTWKGVGCGAHPPSKLPIPIPTPGPFAQIPHIRVVSRGPICTNQYIADFNTIACTFCGRKLLGMCQVPFYRSHEGLPRDRPYFPTCSACKRNALGIGFPRARASGPTARPDPAVLHRRVLGEVRDLVQRFDSDQPPRRIVAGHAWVRAGGGLTHLRMQIDGSWKRVASWLRALRTLPLLELKHVYPCVLVCPLCCQTLAPADPGKSSICRPCWLKRER